MASASTGAEPNSSSASRGLSTIGRPAVLRLVLTTTGVPVSSPKAGQQPGRSADRRPGRRSGPGPCGRRGSPPAAAHATAGATSWTKSMYGLGSGPRPKISPARSSRTMGATGRNCSRPLMSFSRSTLSAWPGMGEQGTVTQSPRPVLGRDPGTRPRRRCRRSPRPRPRRRHRALVADAGRAQRLLDLLVAPAPAQRGVVHRSDPVPELGGHCQGGAERSARVPRRPAGPRCSRNGPSASSRVLATQFSATPPARRGSRPGSARAATSTARAAPPPAPPGCWPPDRRAARRGPWRRAAAPGPGPSQSTPLGPEAAVPGGVHQLPEQRQMPRRPVRRHRHHLVLVAGAFEAEVGGQVLVQQAERVRQRLCGEDVELLVAVLPREHRGRLPAAVGDQHRAVAERAPPARPTPRGRRGAGRSGTARGRSRAAGSAGTRVRGSRRSSGGVPTPGPGRDRPARPDSGSYEYATASRSAAASPPSARHQRMAASGSSQVEKGTGRLPCLRRLKRSSSAAATI